MEVISLIKIHVFIRLLMQAAVNALVDPLRVEEAEAAARAAAPERLHARLPGVVVRLRGVVEEVVRGAEDLAT